jgi:hypothetical protein
MGQPFDQCDQGPLWWDRATYAPLIEADRRTWAWLWAQRQPAFQKHMIDLGNTGTWMRQDRSTWVLLDEDLCRLFQEGYGFI